MALVRFSFQRPPRVVAPLEDEVFDQFTGWQTIPISGAFKGSNLRFRVEGERATIDPETGVLSVCTDCFDEGRTLRVIAENSAGEAAQVIRVTTERDNALAETQVTRDITVDGITFTFRTPAEVGHFFTGGAGEGDPFVIGPVELVSYTPKPRRVGGVLDLNGAMLNPPCATKQGYHGWVSKDGSPKRRSSYREVRNVGRRLPLPLTPGDSLVVAISNPTAENTNQLANRFVVLSCLKDEPAADSFRPPYSGPRKPLYRLSQVQTRHLTNLQSIASPAPPTAQAVNTQFARFVLDTVPNWERNAYNTRLHPPLYGRDLCVTDAAAYLWVNSERPLEDKAYAAAGLIQRGIDRYGVIESARAQGLQQPWQPDGGHNAGRKFSIMFAGLLLGNRNMINLRASTRDLKGEFQEDGMTFYVTPEIVAVSNSDAWKPPYRKRKDRPKQPYTDGMVGIPDWRGKARAEHVNAAWSGHPYRISGNNNAQHGQVLSILAMGLREAWGNEAYFDYHMRFVEIARGAPDPWRFQGGSQARYNPVEGARTLKPRPGWQIHWKSPWA